MKEAEVEKHFCWTVEMAGGKTWKFTSPSHRGVADRIAVLPGGKVWFVELKTTAGVCRNYRNALRLMPSA